MLGNLLSRHRRTHVLEVDGDEATVIVALDAVDEPTQGHPIRLARGGSHHDLSPQPRLRVDQFALGLLVIPQESVQRGRGLRPLRRRLPTGFESERRPHPIDLGIHGGQLRGHLPLRDEVRHRMDDAAEAGGRSARGFRVHLLLQEPRERAFDNGVEHAAGNGHGLGRIPERTVVHRDVAHAPPGGRISEGDQWPTLLVTLGGHRCEARDGSVAQGLRCPRIHGHGSKFSNQAVQRGRMHGPRGGHRLDVVAEVQREVAKQPARLVTGVVRLGDGAHM